jgi:three-Cys-motif partner protein
MILRKYLDAWLPILGAGRHAHEHVVLIDGFAGPGRYSGGEPGSPLIMLEAYLDHSATLDATPHFFFIEEHHERCEHLRQEIAALSLPSKVDVKIIEGSFVDEFPALVDGLRTRFGQLPPTFAFIDPFGAEEIPVALSTPLLEIPRCEVLVYFPVGFLARFAGQPEFKPILDSLYGGEVQAHLFREAWWREHDEWLGPEAPHAPRKELVKEAEEEEEERERSEPAPRRRAGR